MDCGRHSVLGNPEGGFLTGGGPWFSQKRQRVSFAFDRGSVSSSVPLFSARRSPLPLRGVAYRWLPSDQSNACNNTD